jgi:hypothetical protein
MKNNFLFLVVAMLFVSCSKEMRFGKGEISQAEKTYANATISHSRDIAQMSMDSCATDDITENKLIQEIKLLENNKSLGSKVVINKMDLGRFPPAQAEYLEKNKEWIYTRDLDLSQCSDIKCVFSKIYPASDGYEGYLHYYFYLKMGYAISTVNYTPLFRYPDDAKDPEIKKDLEEFNHYAPQDVLFSRDELKGFYYLSKALGPSFQKIPTLKSIHRLPRNKLFYKYPTSCGIAGGDGSKGFVVLLDKCLIRYPTPSRGGDFYSSVTHEFSHMIDFTMLPKNAIFSESQTWMDLSGWAFKENLDQQTGEATKKWLNKQPTSSGLPADGFFREYTAVNPREDFADSIGFARFLAEDVKKVSPRKYAWITKNIFNGKSYTTDGIEASYSSFLIQYSMTNLPKVINECVANNFSYTYNLNASQVNDYKEYDAALIQCIFGGIDNSLVSGIRDLKANEFEGCSYFTSNEPMLKAKVLDQMSSFIKQDLNKNIEIGRQLKVLAEFISRLNEDIDPREVFIACLEDKKPIECYDRELKNSFQTISADYTDKIPNQLLTYQENYFNENLYMAVKGKISELFSKIYSGSDLKFASEAKRKWDSCYPTNTVSGDEQTELLLYPYNGGTQYVKKSLLNCLNKNAESELGAILEKVGKKLGITISNQATKKFILEMYLNSYITQIQSFVNAETDKETTKIKEKKNAVIGKVVSQLTNDTSWLGTTAKTADDVASMCQERSEAIIKEELDNNKDSDLNDLSFHSAADNTWKQGNCSVILNNSRVQGVQEVNQLNAVKQVLPNLDDVLMSTAQATMDKCKRQFSSNSVVILKSRGLCLTNTITWSGIVNAAVDQWIDNENISFISFAKRKGQDYLEAKKTELKNTATKKMNAK